MHKQIYVNLPVADLQKTRAFFTALGFTFEPRFSNDDAACMIIGENIYAMLLTRPFYETFTDKKIADTKVFTAVANCLSCESRQEVDELVARARQAGGTVPRPAKDYGTMYGHGFEDLDGHNWELTYMEPAA
jgi:predicted lactoylglutathione lyase